MQLIFGNYYYYYYYYYFYFYYYYWGHKSKVENKIKKAHFATSLFIFC